MTVQLSLQAHDLHIVTIVVNLFEMISVEIQIRLRVKTDLWRTIFHNYLEFDHCLIQAPKQILAISK